MTPADRLDVPGTTNLRDLGGRPGAAGTLLAPGRLFRSEVVVAAGDAHLQGVWSPEHAPAFTALGLRTVIDLRAEHEVGRVASAWGEATGADVVLLPIAEGGEGTDTDFVRQMLAGTRTRFDAADLATFYAEVLDRRSATFAAAVRVLATPGRLPALIHCSAGKDRTGLLVALVLEVLGTPRPVVVEDYALTGVLRPDRVRQYAPMLEAAGVRPDDVRALFETPADAMDRALEHLDAHHGGAVSYLRRAGVTDAELAELRGALLVPADPSGE